MKTIIYTSGILGVFLFILWLIRDLAENHDNSVLLILATVMLGFVFLPLLLLNKYRHDKKIDEIIQSYKGRKKREAELKMGHFGKEREVQIFPFKERKSGLTWGGGNIHGANATRGTRKPFLKKR